MKFLAEFFKTRENGTTVPLLATAGVLFTAYLLSRNVFGAMLIGILFTSACKAKQKNS